MDFLLANWMLILVALTSGTMLLLPLLQGGGAGLTPTGEIIVGQYRAMEAAARKAAAAEIATLTRLLAP